MQHLENWRPIPLLALHSDADRVIPISTQHAFVERLREECSRKGRDPGMVQFITWPHTGAELEHLGFGKFSNDAKNAQAAFLAQHLGARPRG
jgi:hypothetical protein